MAPSLSSLKAKPCILLAILLLLYPFFFATRQLHRLVSSHSFDLSYKSIYRAQFKVYILTKDCQRFTEELASGFEKESVVLVSDADEGRCKALGYDELKFEATVSTKIKDHQYLLKYANVLEKCYTGDKMKCLILEDDLVLLHNLKRTREVLVENTLSLFNSENNAYDCTKRGFGWLPSGQTGNGSQCRIFSKVSAPCMSECLRTDGTKQEQLDYALRYCQEQCGLEQRRFLLGVHGGLPSTMERGHG